MKSLPALLLPVWLLAFFGLLPLEAKEHCVVIDAGHGGSQYTGSQKNRTLSSPNNATSPSGLKEKNLTLELALEVEKQIKLLASHYPETTVTCILTRRSDHNPDFAARATICANTSPAPSAIVSLHFNASAKHNALGTVAMVNHQWRNQNYHKDHAFALGLTKATSAAVRQFIPASQVRQPITDAHLHQGMGSNFFHQLSLHKNLRHTPRCFLEVEFIDRPDVDQALLKKRKSTFPVIARAIADYLYRHCSQQ